MALRVRVVMPSCVPMVVTYSYVAVPLVWTAVLYESAADRALLALVAACQYKVVVICALDQLTAP